MRDKPRSVRAGLEWEMTARREPQIDALPALSGEHQHQRKGGEEHENYQFKILAAAEKMIPRPKVLCKRRR